MEPPFVFRCATSTPVAPINMPTSAQNRSDRGLRPSAHIAYRIRATRSAGVPFPWHSLTGMSGNLFACSVCSVCVVMLVGAGCGATPTGPSVPPTYQLQPGDIVYNRPANGQTNLTLYMGTGTFGNIISFQCLVVVDSATGLWPCRGTVTLNTNMDYWVYLLPSPDPLVGTDGLLGG